MSEAEDTEKGEVSTSTDVFATPIPLGFVEEPPSQELTYGPPLVLSPDNLNSFGSADLNSSAYFVKKDVCDEQGVRGKCGLYNLGNTCFMNSGVQCLMSNLPLVKFMFTHYEKNREFDVTLLGQFKKLFVKIWSGQYTILHPKEFKQTLGVYHPQFQDYRQHDCQEFLALLLDTLHEQLNCRQQSSNQIMGAGPSSQKQPIEFEHNIINKTETNKEQSVNDQSKKCHSNLTIENDFKQSINKNISSLNQPNHIAQCALVQVSEDSNHSNVSEQSSDSEQCSVIKNLKLRSSPVAGSSNSGGIQDNSVASSDSVQQEFMTKDTRSDVFLKRAESFHDLKDGKVSEIPVTIPKSSSDIDLVKRAHIPEVVSSSPIKLEPNKSGLNDVKQTEEKNMSTDNREISEVENPKAQGDPVVLNNAMTSTSAPSLDDIYAKETKTLNTNMLATEYMSEAVTTDSDKFAKTDNVSTVPEYNDMLLDEGMIHNAIGVPCKNETNKPTKLKDVNIRVDKKSRSPKGAHSSGEIMPAEKEDCFMLTNVKRMKFEGTEKNLQMQEMSKIQKGKISFGEKAGKCSNKNINSFTPQSENLMNEADLESEGESEIMEDQDADMEVSDVDQYDPSDREECTSSSGRSYTTGDLLAAEEAWHKYLMKNDSVIVDTFQGQFKSTVVCSECNNVSVTFEPFMYLSVPIPHAMERQLCVVLITQDAPPTRYLLSLHKQDRIQKVKEELCKTLQRQTTELILAEVLNHHISRILEDNTMLRYVNDSSRMIYAFEMDPTTVQDIQVDDIASSDTAAIDQYTSANQNNKPNNEADIFSQMGSFSADSSVFSNNKYNSDSVIGMCESSSSVSQNNQSMFIPESNDLDMAGTGLWEWNQNTGREARRGSLETEPGESWPMVDSTTSDSLGDKPGDEQGLVINDDNVVSSTSASAMTVTAEWKSCAICLEELSDMELMVHTTCGGTFCPTCLEMSVQHYRDSSYCCPVCSTPAEITEDFVPLVDAANHKPKNRIVTIPLSFRCDRDFTGAENPFMFAHPRMLNLPSNLTGEFAYSMVEKLIPFDWDFQILLTDGQGLHCSRCLYMEHCTGCVIAREGEVVLRPGDNLTVTVQMVTTEELDLMAHQVDHESMKQQRSNDPVTLMDCFTAFTVSEELDENNPWFCPHCKQNQQAKKTMTVWRYPDTLIIHG